jgi:hypothetical protein
VVTVQEHPLGRPAQEVLPNLSDFFAPTFHQDWVDEYATADEALAAAIDGWSDGDLEPVRRELAWLLEQPLYEAFLDRVVFDELGMSYWTYADGLSPRVWLHQVLDRVVQATWR